MSETDFYEDFYEDDEPTEKIWADWESGEIGLTGKRDDADLSLEEAKELMADAEPAELVDCADCAAPYNNPFETQPLRFLWWLDDSLHRRHTINWLQRRLCNFVDRMLLRDL